MRAGAMKDSVFYIGYLMVLLSIALIWVNQSGGL